VPVAGKPKLDAEGVPRDRRRYECQVQILQVGVAAHGYLPHEPGGLRRADPQRGQTRHRAAGMISLHLLPQGRRHLSRADCRRLKSSEADELRGRLQLQLHAGDAHAEELVRMQ